MTTPVSGDKAITPQTADGKVPAYKITAANTAGAKAVIIQAADGRAVPMEVEAVTEAGQASFPAQAADGRVIFVKEKAAAGTLYLAGDIAGNYDPAANFNHKAVLWDSVLNRWRDAGSDGGLRMSYPQYFMNGSDGTLYHYGRNLLSGWGNVTYNGIVKWSDDDEDWASIFSSVTGGIGNYCFGMIENTTDIFTIFGDNTDINGTTVNMVFTWDKTDDTITDLGTGLPVGWSYIQFGGYLSNGDLIVVGNNEVYKLSGGSWSDITPMSGGSIASATVYNGEFVVGGSMADISGDTSKKYLFSYDGAAWSLVSQYVFGGTVNKVQAVGNELYVYCTNKTYNGNPITITCIYNSTSDEFEDIPDESQHLWDKSADFPKDIQDYSGILQMDWNTTAFDDGYYDPRVHVTHAGGDSDIIERPDLFTGYIYTNFGFSENFMFKFSSYNRQSVIGVGGIVYDTDTQNFNTPGRLGPMEVKYVMNEDDPDEWDKYSTNLCSPSHFHPTCVWMGKIGSDICALRWCYVKSGTSPTDKVYYNQSAASINSLQAEDYSVEGWQLVKLNDENHWEEYIEGKGVFTFNTYAPSSDNRFDGWQMSWGNNSVHIKDNGKVIFNVTSKQIDGVNSYGLVELDVGAGTFTPIGPTSAELSGDCWWAGSFMWGQDNYYCWNYDEGENYEVISCGTAGSATLYWDEDTRSFLGGCFLYRTKRDGAGGWQSLLPMCQILEDLDRSDGDALPVAFENPLYGTVSETPQFIITHMHRCDYPYRDAANEEVWATDAYVPYTMWGFTLGNEFPVSLLSRYVDGEQAEDTSFAVDESVFIQAYCFHDDKLWFAGNFSTVSADGDSDNAFGLFSWDGTIMTGTGVDRPIADVTTLPTPLPSDDQSHAGKATRMISLNDRLWIVGGQFQYNFQVQTSDAPVTKPIIISPLAGICYLDTENNRLWMDKTEFEPKDADGNPQVHGYGTGIYPWQGSIYSADPYVYNVSL